jgi:hypothetical protein
MREASGPTLGLDFIFPALCGSAGGWFQPAAADPPALTPIHREPPSHPLEAEHRPRFLGQSSSAVLSAF